MRKLVTIDARMIKSSGIGTYISNIVPKIISSMKDIDFCILGHKEECTILTHNSNVKMIEFNANIYSIYEQIGLLKKIPARTELFWSPHYNVPIFYKGKLLVTIHDVFHLAMQEYVHGLTKKSYAKFMFNRIKNQSEKILTVSKFTKDELIKYTGCNKQKIVITYNGVNKSWFDSRDSFDSNLNRKHYILYVGNVKPHKNLFNLIQAFKLIVDKIPHDLIIVGKKEGFITSDKQTIQLSYEKLNRISFTGFVKQDQLKKLVTNADLFVFPSLYEGFGLPPIEAMATGTATIVSDIPVLREICGDSVRYFDPYNIDDIANTIISTVNNEKEMKRLQKAGREQASIYSWEKAAKLTEKTIRSILDN